MSLPWITINSRLQAGVSLMNALSRTKFSLLLKRIVESSDKDEIFTQNELEKLGDSLKLNEANLQLLIQSTLHIFQQSSKVILKPTILQEQLIETLKLDPQKAEDFVNVWTEETKTNVDLENCKRLEDISWDFNIQGASTFCNTEANPEARIQLTLKDNVEKDEENENVVLVVDEQHLQQLYQMLEKIQTKLDALQ